VNVDASNVATFIAKDPALFVSHFEHRVKQMIAFILGPKNPIGKVVHFFYRNEYQGRGATHKHCLFWVEGAPQIGRDSDEKIKEFIEKYATCRLPDREAEPMLYQLVDENQRHRCTGESVIFYSRVLIAL